MDHFVHGQIVHKTKYVSIANLRIRSHQAKSILNVGGPIKAKNFRWRGGK